MFSTGPMFLSLSYIDYIRQQEDEWIGDIHIINNDLYGGDGNNDNNEYTLFKHVEGSSWHNADDFNVNK